MAMMKVFFSDLKSGRCSSVVEHALFLIRYQAFLTFFCLPYEQATMMPVTVNVNRFATHMPNTSPALTYAACYNTSWILRLHVWQRVDRD